MNRISFHIPGHKGKIPGSLSPRDIFKLDTTEIYGMDNLYDPSGIIKTSQVLAAKLYGACGSFFLTGGSTAGVITAMRACLSAGDLVIIARNCHRSVITGLIITGAIPLYIERGAIEPRRIAQNIENAKAVIITSPTYEGEIYDIDNISRITKAAGAFLIVDGAHGAHFPFSDYFPPHPMTADIVISGLHKTLPVLGQSALLNVYNKSLLDKTAAALPLSQTSSPSYLLMACIDNFFCDYVKGLYDFDAYAKTLLEIRQRLKDLKRIKLINSADISRFVFLLKGAEDFERTLRDEYEIDIEAAYKDRAIAISSVADSCEDLDALARAVLRLDNEYESSRDDTMSDTLKIPEMILPPRAARDMPYEYVDIDNCAGRIAWDIIAPAPPGISVICPGEMIDRDMAAYLTRIYGRSLRVI